MKTIQDVRQEILKELNLDVSDDTIRRDEIVGLFESKRDKDNDYRLYTDEVIDTIKYIALLKDIGIPRERVKEVLDGNKELIWERLNQLSNISMPKLKIRIQGN